MKINIYFLMGLMIGGMGTAYADDGLDTAMDQDNESSSHSHPRKCGFGRIFCFEKRSLEAWYQDMQRPLMSLQTALKENAKRHYSAKEAQKKLEKFMVKMGDLLRIKADTHLHMDRNLSADEIQERTTKEINRIHDQFEWALQSVFGDILRLYFDLPFSQFCSSDHIKKSVRFGDALSKMRQQMWDKVNQLRKVSDLV